MIEKNMAFLLVCRISYDFADLRSFRPISALCSKNNPRNINYMPADFGEPATSSVESLSRTVIFFACPVCVPACACPHLPAVQAAQAGLILNENPHKSTESSYNISKIPAAPIPPPIHMDTIPFFDLRLCISWSN